MELATGAAPPGHFRRVIQRDQMIAELNLRFAFNLVSIESTYQVCLHILICNHVPKLTFLYFVGNVYLLSRRNDTKVALSRQIESRRNETIPLGGLHVSSPLVFQA